MRENWTTYNFEYEQKVKVCFIGAGGHSFRNVYPTFQYAPIDLLAICDVNAERASSYARQFGAKKSYTDYRVMLREEQPDAVFIVTAYEADGRVQATNIAKEVMEAGAHVWMEKPTASSCEEIAMLMAVSERTGKHVMTGTKKVFFPSIQKTKEIMLSEEFGGATSFYLRYPMQMPPLEKRADLRNLNDLLDHIFHPASIMHELFGKIAHVTYEWEPTNGGSVSMLQFESGVIGTMHLTAGSSGSSPLERLEVIGQGCNVVVENGVKLTYYRKANRPAYGRSPNYLVSNEEAPLYWEPEFSLGQLINKNIFYLGYVAEVLHFCEAILADEAPSKGTLEASMEILKLFEAYRQHPPGQRMPINGV